MARRTLPFLRPLVPLAIVALAAAACGGDEGATGEPGAADAPAEAPEETGAPADDLGDGLGFGEVPLAGASIVKTAEVAVVVPEGGFTPAFDEAMSIPGRYGGFVASSSSSGTQERAGRLVLRIPSTSFEQALSDARALGEVEGQSISGQDVSAEFVDLEARLRTWEAQEVVLLRLMDDATSVEDTLTVQRELQDVQLRIEQITGQLRALQDRTDYGTLEVGIRESDAPAAVPGDERPAISDAWNDAVSGFLGVVYSVVVFAGYAVPLSALGLIVWLVVRRVRPTVRRPSAPA